MLETSLQHFKPYIIIILFYSKLKQSCQILPQLFQLCIIISVMYTEHNGTLRYRDSCYAISRKVSRHLTTEQHGKAERMMGNGVTPDTDTESSLPTVGVVAALRELVEEMEEVLSARASGAKGGGLDE